MICSSLNRERFIRPSPLIDGLYQNLEEVQGLRSIGQVLWRVAGFLVFGLCRPA